MNYLSISSYELVTIKAKLSKPVDMSNFLEKPEPVKKFQFFVFKMRFSRGDGSSGEALGFGSKESGSNPAENMFTILHSTQKFRHGLQEVNRVLVLRRKPNFKLIFLGWNAVPERYMNR